VGLQSGNVLSLKDDIPFRRGIEAANHIEKGAFPRPVWAYEANHFRVENIEIQFIEGGQADEVFAEGPDL
jgi:hypothetical protein